MYTDAINNAALDCLYRGGYIWTDSMPGIMPDESVGEMNKDVDYPILGLSLQQNPDTGLFEVAFIFDAGAFYLYVGEPVGAWNYFKTVQPDPQYVSIYCLNMSDADAAFMVQHHSACGLLNVETGYSAEDGETTPVSVTQG